ncbi:DUF2235 domain-containing protein [Acinetobacter baumannii]|uniref:phospholipase effector Tle1 domain-containing protein n=1 Tax=Acinetobacter baumannii TaxID=470 RepID=UPI0023422935|nr:DUF2235 domain-containing protein [Acinetobacter baumannii]MDC4972854.1 DUF2235 domain-containing protein [Acinetobacter baumannii]MDC5305652.1 DUF2235 domain-containing protein [Acinetobacter baumannii]MDC5397222.1 DUF2235 domain-containing protein [Acinetobacter baumannii]WGQ06188.1 DUF2235 domain-containing protein [Acinetobacter baumannii]
MVKVRDPLQTTEYHYNDQDQLERRVISYQGLKHPLVTYYRYNSKAEPLAMILPDGTQLETSKNKILYRTAPQWQRQTLIEKQDFNDKTSDQKQLTYVLGNQLRLSFEYSPTGIWRGLHYAKGSPKKSLSLIKSAYANEISTLLLSQHWKFNDRHQISHVSDHGLLQDQQKYLYDSKQHVIAHFNATFKPQEMYFYDALGNRLIGQNQQAQQTVQDYHYQSGRLTNIRKSNEQIAIQYNTAGEPIKYPTSQGQLRFSYINGQIAKVWHAQQLIASYQYNDAGQRIKKTIYIDQQQKTLKHPQISYYFYNGTQLAGELNADGRITRQYIYTGDRLLAIMDYAGSGHTPQLEPLTLWQRITALFSNHEPDAQWHYVVNDYMGRPRMVTDQQQHVVWQDQGKALFGESKVIHQGYKLNMRYAGQYADAETGLYYNGYRYYDPATGRYTTPDPLGLAGGENLYGYVNQQPNQYFDPQGLLLFAFDGTGNTDDHVANNAFMHNGDDNRDSNVARFRDTYDGSADEQATGIKISTTKWQNQQKTYASSGQKFEGFYISGAGTTDPYTNLKAINNGIDAGTGGSVPDRVDQMLTYFADYMKQAMANQQKKAQISNGNSQYKQITIPIDVVGFSRGAASARMFSSKLDNLLSQKISPSAYSSSKSLSLVWGNLSRVSLKCLGITIDYRFLGVWDTVPALGAVDDNDIKDTTNANMSLSVSNKFAYVAHAVAVNEHRSNFMGRSIYNSTSDAQKRDIDEKNIASQVKGKKQVMIERGFMGAHSDIGGGYNEGDLNKVPLMWMINQAKNIGIHFNDDLIKYRQYGVVSNPVIHDSVGDIKAGTSGGGFGLALMPPGRDFAWSGLNTSIDTYVNQHLTGMTQQQMQALGYTGKYLDPATVNHLKLDWDDTRQFENEKSDKKFSQTARLELAYQQTLRCQSLGITCDELEQYQDLKSLGLDDNGRQKTGDIPGTILYRTDTANEIIQINNYLNWISKNYGTALTTSGRK